MLHTKNFIGCFVKYYWYSCVYHVTIRMADPGAGASGRRCTDDPTHQISDIVQKCTKACNSYRKFSDDLTALVTEQDSIFQQHQDLLEDAYAELKARCATPFHI